MAGMEALSSMSMEKNYKHWHGDIETTDTPVDAGTKYVIHSSFTIKRHIFNVAY